MDWDKLRIFHAVAEAGSFTRAGEGLNLSQSAVSRQISTLEDSLGVLLFHRHARGLLLTEQGELLHETARDIFGKLAMIEGQLSDSKQLPEGTLRITVAGFIGSTWLAPRLAALQNEHPNLQITLLLDDRILDLGMREADAAIRLYKPEQPDLIQRHLVSVHFHVCASTAYIKKHGKPESVKELKEHTLISYPEGVLAPFSEPNWLLRVAGINPGDNKKILMMNSMIAIHQAIENHVGLAVLPNYLVAGNKNIEILLLDVERPPVDMYFVYPEERRHSKRIAVFRDFLLEIISKTPF